MNIDPATLAAGMAEAMGGPLATDSEIERTRDRMNDHLERVRADTLRQLEAIQAENGAAERPCPDLAAHVRDVMAQVGRMSLAELKEIQSEPWFNPIGESKAYARGAARARYLRQLERRGIVGAAVNPYRTADKRAQWEAGFHSTYYGI